MSDTNELVEKTQRAPMLFFVDRGEDERELPGYEYPLVPAASSVVGARPVEDVEQYDLALNFVSLFAGNMPDFRANEGMFTAEMKTLANGTEFPASRIVNFTVNDNEYSGGFESHGAFSNIQLKQLIDLHVRLVEVDGHFADGFNKVSKIVSDSGLLEVDAAKGIPYLEVGAKLVSGVVNAFGKNTNDLLWDEVMRMEVADPVHGSAFLRNGIYAVIDRDEKDSLAELAELEAEAARYSYKDNALYIEGEPLRVTHFTFGIRLRPAG